MTKRKRHTGYKRQIVEALSSGQLRPLPGTVTDVNIYHDDNCAIWDGRECNCKPDIVHIAYKQPKDEKP